MNRKKTASKYWLPRTAIMELTYKCNQKCFFCYCPWENEKFDGAELTTEEIFKSILILKKNHISHISLTGGEPTLRSDLRQIIKFIRNHNISVSIITNGILLDNSLLSFFKQYDVQLSISVPGIETFEKHTGINNIDKLLKCFTQAKELGIRTAANITVTKLNIHEVYENVSLPIIYGADYVLLNRFIPGGRGLKNKELMLSISEIQDMMIISEEVLSKAKRYGHLGVEIPFCIVADKNKFKYLKYSTQCGAAKTFFVIDPSGYIRVCNHSPERLCKIEVIDSLKQNKYWNKFIKSDYSPSMCIGCSNHDICDGGCREAANVCYGAINMSDPCFETVNDL